MKKSETITYVEIRKSFADDYNYAAEKQRKIVKQRDDAVAARICEMLAVAVDDGEKDGGALASLAMKLARIAVAERGKVEELDAYTELTYEAHLYELVSQLVKRGKIAHVRLTSKDPNDGFVITK